MHKHLSKKNIFRWSIGIILSLILIYLLLGYFDRHPSTDDAYVQADTVNIAAQVTGPIIHIAVKDHEYVKADQLLFEIDPSLFIAAVDKATANVATQTAALTYAIANAKRVLHLVSIGQETQAIGDQAQSQLDSAKASLAGAQAQLMQAKLDLQHTKVTAPHSGIVTSFVLRPGNNVVANTTLFMLVEQDHFWIDANFKETQVEHIKPGQPASIVVDMFSDHTFHGVVDAVSSASGSIFSLLPPENASGNWIKVTQRFPVKIWITDLDPKFPLRAGATADVTVDTTQMVAHQK